VGVCVRPWVSRRRPTPFRIRVDFKPRSVPPKQVLDVWVDSFNPEFIEKSMAAVLKPLMTTLWSHLKPHPYPFGAKVGPAFFMCLRIPFEIRRGRGRVEVTLTLGLGLRVGVTLGLGLRVGVTLMLALELRVRVT
jgi:hypothetical protein